LERREEDRMPKTIFTQELEGWRRRGRPRKGWREEVERDLQVLGVRRWRKLVIKKNREIFFDRPKPTVGCSAKGRILVGNICVYIPNCTASGYVRPESEYTLLREPHNTVEVIFNCV
jgi:hypothetical protein